MMVGRRQSVKPPVVSASAQAMALAQSIVLFCWFILSSQVTFIVASQKNAALALFKATALPLISRAKSVVSQVPWRNFLQ